MLSDQPLQEVLSKICPEEPEEALEQPARYSYPVDFPREVGPESIHDEEREHEKKNEKKELRSYKYTLEGMLDIELPAVKNSTIV